MNETISMLKLTLIAAVSVVLAYFNALLIPIVVLVAVMVIDYISGMSDNFCLDCGNEILRPEHLNQSIERSLTGKWFDVVR